MSYVKNYDKNYRYSPSTRFRPKRPIRSFRDLGIYQSTNQISVEIMKKIVPGIPDESSLKKDLADCSMTIPHLIAEAHSRRFDEKPKSMKLIEEVLFLCNKVVVFLEQARDIYGESSEQKQLANTPSPDTSGSTPLRKGNEQKHGFVDPVLINEIIKKYFYARQKVFNFYKSWKRFEKNEK